MIEADAIVRVAGWAVTAHRARVFDDVLGGVFDNDIPGGGGDIPGFFHDDKSSARTRISNLIIMSLVHREQHKQKNGKDLPSRQQVLGFLSELEIDKIICHPVSDL